MAESDEETLKRLKDHLDEIAHQKEANRKVVEKSKQIWMLEQRVERNNRIIAFCHKIQSMFKSFI